MLSFIIVRGHLIPSESCRKKMSSLEKDRQDLQSTIEALQEGKYASPGVSVFIVCIWNF